MADEVPTLAGDPPQWPATLRDLLRAASDGGLDRGTVLEGLAADRPPEDGATDDGAVYEDTVEHLSESERAVVGLVVALAGYLVHDVHETVPIMLLDSLEAIDADRIAALVEHFTDFVPFLVVALLPEDAAVLPGEYDRIRMGDGPS